MLLSTCCHCYCHALVWSKQCVCCCCAAMRVMQISVSLDRNGINATCQHVLAARFDATPDEEAAMQQLVAGSPLPLAGRRHTQSCGGQVATKAPGCHAGHLVAWHLYGLRSVALDTCLDACLPAYPFVCVCLQILGSLSISSCCASISKSQRRSCRLAAWQTRCSCALLHETASTAQHSAPSWTFGSLSSACGPFISCMSIFFVLSPQTQSASCRSCLTPLLAGLRYTLTRAPAGLQ